MSKIPTPGSDEAITQGCICPILDNSHGRGIMGDGEHLGYVIVENCPLHDPQPATEGQAAEEYEAQR